MEKENFEWISLDRDEKIVWSGEPEIASIVPALVIGVLTLPLMGLGLLIMAVAYLTIENTDFVVTNQGLYKKTGILSRNVQKIGFDKVQNISFSQTAIGKYFGYGNVDISTAGGSGIEMSFNSVAEPQQVQELINRRIKGSSAESSGDCPECGHTIREGWLACPECGTRVREVCDNCSHLLQPEWSHCPYCGMDQSE